VGGGAHSSSWAQALANVLNVPVEQMDGIVNPALGIALLAAYAQGFIPSLEAIANATVKVKRVFLPEPERAPCERDVPEVPKNLSGAEIRLQLNSFLNRPRLGRFSALKIPGGFFQREGRSPALA
jgi:glycerol kinase